MSLGPGARRHLDVEWVAMRAGLKPATRVSIDAGRVTEVEARARRDGLAVVHAARVVEFPGRAPAAILYVAPDEHRARAVADAERPLLPPDNAQLALDREVESHTELGRLLGFPACCVDEFCRRLRRGINVRLDGTWAHEDFVAAETAASASRGVLGRLNDLSPDRRMRIVTFYPCRYDCPIAADYAAAVLAAAERVDPVATAALRSALLGTMRIGIHGARGGEARAGEHLALDFERL